MGKRLIEGAFLSGFEPSNENLIAEQLFAEAQAYLLENLTK